MGSLNFYQESIKQYYCHMGVEKEEVRITDDNTDALKVKTILRSTFRTV